MTSARTVTAARLVSHGQPLEVGRVPLGEPGEGEVLVELSFAGVNPLDRYVAIGRVAPDAPLPRTLGVEGVGTVGGRVVALSGHSLGTVRPGLWAEAAVVPAAVLVDVPDGVELAAAASIGVAGATAWRTVADLAQVGADDRVLVLGASGGVGSMIVSLARSAGATVWGQTGHEAKRAAIEAWGADRAIAVESPGTLARSVAELAPTVVFDPLGDGFTGAAVESLAQGGRLVLFGTSVNPEGQVPLQALYRKSLSLLGYGGLSEPPEMIRRAMAGALEALRDGRLRVEVDSVLPLAEVNGALDRLARREVTGKLVLDLGR